MSPPIKWSPPTGWCKALTWSFRAEKQFYIEYKKRAKMVTINKIYTKSRSKSRKNLFTFTMLNQISESLKYLGSLIQIYSSALKPTHIDRSKEGFRLWNLKLLGSLCWSCILHNKQWKTKQNKNFASEGHLLHISLYIFNNSFAFLVLFFIIDQNIPKFSK